MAKDPQAGLRQSSRTKMSKGDHVGGFLNHPVLAEDMILRSSGITAMLRYGRNNRSNRATLHFMTRVLGLPYLNARPALRRAKIEERGVPIVIPTGKIFPSLSRNKDMERLEQALHR